jgi:hypothetical protein
VNHTYVLIRDGKEYDSKAIAGAALAYQPGVMRPLAASRFSGDEAGAARRLRELGFTVRSSVPAREVTATSVRAAMAEWDRLGREPFLLRHGAP